MTFSWDSSGADYCESDGYIVPPSGSFAGGPYPAGVYGAGVSCTGPSGTGSAGVSWEVIERPVPTEPPSLDYFYFSPSSVTTSDLINLYWSSTNASGCVTDVGNTFGPGGSTTFPAGTLAAGNYSFTMWCDGEGGTSNSVSANVSVSTPVPTPVLNSFSASASTIRVNDSVVVNWSSTNATACSTGGPGYAANGPQTFSGAEFPLGASQFTMTCTGPGGVSNSLSLSMTVLPPLPVLNSLSLSSNSITTAQSVTASWNAQYHDSCTAGGEVFPAGVTSTTKPAGTYPVGTHVFEMHCSNAQGDSNILAATVTVTQPAVPVPAKPTGFTLTDTTPDLGQAYTVSWSSVSGATSYKLSQNGTVTTLSGVSNTSKVYTKTSPGTFTYKVRACNASGCSSYTSTKTATVAPLVPSGLAVSDTTPDTGQPYTVTWGAVSGATSYKIYQNGVATTVSTPSNSYTQSSPGIYGYTVSACANSSNCSATSGVVSVEVSASPPSTPTEVSVSNSTAEIDQSYSVSWSAVPGASSYNVYQNGGATSTTSLSRSYSQSSAGTYSYTVSACNAVGCSAQSGAISVTVAAPGIDLIGFDGEYRVYAAAGAESLLVIRNSSDGNTGGVAPFILEPDTTPGAPNYYRIDTQVTQSDISFHNVLISNAYSLTDINQDGATDMMLVGLEEDANRDVGQQDTIVYSSLNSNAAPLGLVGVDGEFEQFFNELNGFIEDEIYYRYTASVNGWCLRGDSICRVFEANPVTQWWSTFYLASFSFSVAGHGSFIEIEEGEFTNPLVQPSLCVLIGGGVCEYTNGVWRMHATYYEFVEWAHDFSNFHQDGLEVARTVDYYQQIEESVPANVSSAVLILAEILGTGYDVDTEADIINTIRRIGQVLFGYGVPQLSDVPRFSSKIEIVYTDILLTGLPPFARHAYLQITTPSGKSFYTRGGPDNSYGLFGNITINTADDTTFPFFRDYGKAILFRQLVGYTTMTEFAIEVLIGSYGNGIDACNIPYILLAQNSNSYAFQTADLFNGILPRPKPLAWVPGWSKALNTGC